MENVMEKNLSWKVMEMSWNLILFQMSWKCHGILSPGGEMSWKCHGNLFQMNFKNIL